jgi:DNA polymerase delta subunit 2
LEDESGRIKLSGDKISTIPIVSGVVMGALGVETNSGDFEVLDVCFPGPAPQEPTVENPTEDSMDLGGTSEWIALVSGLNIGPPNAAADVRITLLVEYLLSEAGSRTDQQSASSIARLILAGDSFAPLSRHDPDEAGGLGTTDVASKMEHQRNQGDDMTFSAHPTQSLAGHIADLARVMTVHLVPGAADPAGATLPQQPMPRAMFGEAKMSEGFSTETNPCWLGVEGCE